MADTFFEDITQRWFITEPALFSVYCTHHVEQNTRMKCPIRTGRGIIQYNPNLIPKDKAVREEYLKTELVRIMLKHPYARQPENVKKLSTAIASDMVLDHNLNPRWRKFIGAHDLGLECGRHFEWYAYEVDKMIDEEMIQFIKISGMSAEELDAIEEISYMWEEDEFMQTEVNEVIKNVKDWGSLPGKTVARIKANLAAKIDYRKALAGFRASVVSYSRSLTRMKPNRRFGFEAMGSKYNMSYNILVAVDVSASVSDEMLGNFFGVVSKFFKHDVAKLDVIQFDAEIIGEPMRLTKKIRPEERLEIKGRGGTCFQPVFDYVMNHRQYDGLVVLTDGYADVPQVDSAIKAKVLWVCTDKSTYDAHHKWMERMGRAIYIEQ